jgi:hypothetical protein
MIGIRNHKILCPDPNDERKDVTMKTITKEYLLLFNAITDLEQTLEHLRRELLDVQRQAEELFLSEET